jgi:GNAT superfamily N-acetyltransferase
MIAVVVRRARDADVAFVAQDGYVAEDRVARQIAAGEVWIAEDAAGPLGYLRLEYLWGRVPYIALIRVLPRHRGQGAGRALLSAAEQHAAAEGHAWLYSSSQADEPEPQAWHRHMGFAECGFLAGVNEGGIGEVFFRKAPAGGESTLPAAGPGRGGRTG